MTFPMKGMPSAKRNRSKLEEDAFLDPNGNKKIRRYDLASIMGSSATFLNRNRIYNIGVRKKPAELFRKDLISAMKMADSDQLLPEEYLLITDPWKEEWEKGVQVPVNPDSLPEPIILTVDESQRIKHPPVDAKSSPSKTSSSSSSPSSPPSKPESPVKKTKKIELKKYEPERDPLASKYELDLMDACWLRSVREDEENGICVPESVFEEIMNELEYNCGKNMKAKHVGIEFDDHIVCDVCKSPDAEDGNEMVFCDSCNICVHQACYGINVIPDGEWNCRPCTDLGNEKTVSCILCPNTGGAFKPTNNNKWAHVSCALWIPEVSIASVTTMEPITKIKSIPPSRWQLLCSFCKINQGAPIQCSVPSCKVAYHVTCAFSNNLRMKAVVEDGDSKGINLKSFCPRHSDESTTDSKNRRRSLSSSCDSEHPSSSNKPMEIDIANPMGTLDSDKNNRFWMYIDLNEINRVLMHKRSQKEFKSISASNLAIFIDLTLQYWKLKRTSNCGLPLIKVVTADTIEEIEHARRTDILRLRVNLERIRNLSYMICRREKLKRSWLVSHYTSICKSISMTTGTPILSLLEPESERYQSSPEKSNSSPVRQLFVSDDKIAMVRSIIASNDIYTCDYSADKIRAKRVIKDLNRWIELEKLRKRRPNPYAKTFMPQIKRSGSMSGCSSTSDHQSDLVVSKMSGFKSPTLKSQSLSVNKMTPKKSPPSGVDEPVMNGGSSILMRNQNNSPSPGKRSYSPSPGKRSYSPSPGKRSYSPEPVLSSIHRRLSPATSPISSSTENHGTSLLVKSSKSTSGQKRPLSRSTPSGQKRPLSRSTPIKSESKMINVQIGEKIVRTTRAAKAIVPNGRSNSIHDGEDIHDTDSSLHHSNDLIQTSSLPTHLVPSSLPTHLVPSSLPTHLVPSSLPTHLVHHLIQTSSLPSDDVIRVPSLCTHLADDVITIKRHSLGLERHSPGLKRHSPGLKRHSPGLKRHSPGLKRHSPGLKRHSPGLKIAGFSGKKSPDSSIRSGSSGKRSHLRNLTRSMEQNSEQMMGRRDTRRSLFQ